MKSIRKRDVVWATVVLILLLFSGGDDSTTVKDTRSVNQRYYTQPAGLRKSLQRIKKVRKKVDNLIGKLKLSRFKT